MNQKPKPNLILHCGGQHVSMKEINAVQTPSPTQSWHPIPHHDLIQQVQNTLKHTNLRLGAVSHSLSHEGLRYFGLMEIEAKQQSEDYTWVLGLRNSHDKTFPCGIVAGAQVFVCDNLSFSGEINLARRHTRFISRDLPMLVERSVGELMTKWHTQDKRINAYKEAEIQDRDAHDLCNGAKSSGRVRSNVAVG